MNSQSSDMSGRFYVAVEHLEIEYIHIQSNDWALSYEKWGSVQSKYVLKLQKVQVEHTCA